MYTKDSALVRELMNKIEEECLRKTKDGTPIGKHGEYVYYIGGTSQSVADILNKAINKESMNEV